MQKLKNYKMQKVKKAVQIEKQIYTGYLMSFFHMQKLILTVGDLLFLMKDTPL